uniref:Uncharacterized protein n=1 Tax=viral metagenome TaxID=1070528 RepID=A0A6H1ZET8_9ZZZZ
MKQYSLFANRLSTSGQITRKYTAVRADGTNILLRVRDDGTNSHIEWYNSVDDAWDTLLPNQTTGLTYGFTGFNTSTQDEVWWCNGTENMTLWVPIIGSVASNTATVITLNEVAATAGFPSTGTVIVNGTEYTYTGTSGSTLTGLTALPTFDANEGVALAADDSTHSALTKYNILHTADARMWGASTTGVTLAYSAVGDATNWTASTAPANPGSIDLVEGAGPITGLSSLGGNAIDENIFVFKQDLTILYTLEYPSATTRTERVKPIRNSGASNPLGVAKGGETIFYITRKGGIKSISLSQLSDGFNFEDITDLIRPTLENGVFTSASLGYFEKKRTLLLAYKKNSDSTRNDGVVAVELIKDPELGQHQALTTLDWFVNDWAEYNDEFYFGASFEPNSFKAFDGYSKDGQPFQSIFTTGRMSFGVPFVKKEIPYMLITGWKAPGTKIDLELQYDYRGTLASFESDIPAVNPEGFKYIIEPQYNLIGSFELGTEPIGGTLEDIDELNYFMIFFELPYAYQPFDIQLNGNTFTEGFRYKIETIGFLKEDISRGVVIPDNLKRTFKSFDE